MQWKQCRGIATKAIGKFSKNAHCPVIAGGLIETREEAIAAINAGAVAVSASRKVCGICDCPYNKKK